MFSAFSNSSTRCTSPRWCSWTSSCRWTSCSRPSWFRRRRRTASRRSSSCSSWACSSRRSCRRYSSFSCSNGSSSSRASCSRTRTVSAGISSSSHFTVGLSSICFVFVISHKVFNVFVCFMQSYSHGECRSDQFRLARLIMVFFSSTCLIRLRYIPQTCVRASCSCTRRVSAVVSRRSSRSSC